ncbi:hypothetical protein Dimus_021348 [Dionaea muscipula]
MEANERFGDLTIGSVPTVIYVPDFITTDAEETQLMNRIYQAPVSKWKTLKNRRLQNWGGVVHEKGLLGHDLPPWLTKITQRIFKESKVFPAEPNHVLINEYLPDQGIMPHQDGPAYFPAAAIISLGSPVVMDFTPHPKLVDVSQSGLVHDNCDGLQYSLERFHDHQRSFSVLLMPRSLLIFKDLAYSDYLHGIEDSKMHYCDRVVNLSESTSAHGIAQLLPGFEETVEEGTSRDFKVIRRTTKRISLTCRFVPKVHKNLFKVC